MISFAGNGGGLRDLRKAGGKRSRWRKFGDTGHAWPWGWWRRAAAPPGRTDARSGRRSAIRWKPMNRFFFDFNQRLDRNAALPAATAYTRDGAAIGARQPAQSAGQSGRPGHRRQRPAAGRVRGCRHRGGPLPGQHHDRRGGHLRRRHRLGPAGPQPRFRRDPGHLWRAARALSGAAVPRLDRCARFRRQLCRRLFLAAALCPLCRHATMSA